MITRFRLENFIELKQGDDVDEVKQRASLELADQASQMMKFLRPNEGGCWECTDDVVSAVKSGVDGLNGSVIGYKGRMVFIYRGAGREE